MKHSGLKKLTIVIIMFLFVFIYQLAMADSFIFPTGLKEIEDEAFFNDASLDEVVLPEGIERIGNRAFANSTVKKITLPDSVVQIAGDAFEGTSSSLTFVVNEKTYAADWAANFKQAETEGLHGFYSVPSSYFNGNEYRIMVGKCTWNQARIKCKQLGGHLVTITSAEEQAFIESYMKSITNAERSYWIGLTDEYDPNSWKTWDNNEKLSYANWEKDQPDNLNGNQSYTRIAASTFTDANGFELFCGEWDDEADDYALISGFICEWENNSQKEISGSYKGHRYQIFLKGATWEQANVSCNQLGGHLLTINSPQEQDYIETLMKLVPEAAKPYAYWLGARLDTPGDSWDYWITGEWIDYTNWEKGQPDNYYKNELYAIIAGSTTERAEYWTFNFGKWDDTKFGEGDGDGVCPYICEWGIDFEKVEQEPVFIQEHAGAYEKWWNENVAALYKTYLANTYSSDEIKEDHNFLLRKMAELADLKKDEDTANANQWKEKYNSEDNFWLLDDEARLRLTLTNLAKIIQKDEAKEAAVVRKDLLNVSLVSMANQEVALMDNQLHRMKDALDFAVNGCREAVMVYTFVENGEGGTDELTDKQKIAKAFIDAFKDALLRLPTAVMERIIEIQADYDAAYILRTYTQEYVAALKDRFDAYADYLADTYFGTNKYFTKDNDDYYGQAVKMFITAFRKAGNDESRLIEEARKAILSGTGYSYDEVIEIASNFSSDFFSRLDTKFWCEQIVYLLQDIAKNFLEEIFDRPDEKQIIDLVTNVFKFTIEDDLQMKFDFDWETLYEEFKKMYAQESFSLVFTGLQLSDESFNKSWAGVKKYIIGDLSDVNATDTCAVLKDNLKVAGKLLKLTETAWKIGEDILKISHELIELNQIGEGKTLYDTYGCALIDAFGQRLNMRSKGEILTGMTDEHFATWDVKKKEAQRQALISLLNLDEYIVITYKNMKTINAASDYSLNKNYVWEDDNRIDYALMTIRNIRNAIRNVPEDCRIYAQ